jgi:cytochrome P450
MAAGREEGIDMLEEEPGTKGGPGEERTLPKVKSASLTFNATTGEKSTYEPFTELPKGVGPGDLYNPKPPGKFAQGLVNFMFGRVIPGVFALLRMIAPVFKIPFTNVTLLTRFDDVQEVFSRNKDFVVPYIKMAGPLRWDPTFVLAMKHDDEAYKHMIGNMRALWLDSDLDFITDIANTVSKDALKANGGKIDAVQDLMLPVVLHVLKDYYGMPMVGLEERDAVTNKERKYDDLTDDEKHNIDRLEAFIAGTNAIAGYVFGPQTLNEKKERKIHWAANSVWPYLYEATNNYEHAPPKDTIIGRARDLRERHKMNISDAELRSILLGMIAGFLPTNTNANGKAFDVLMKTPNAKAAAQQAVDNEDDTALLGIIYEAQRHQYILPGLWRMTEKDQILGVGRKRQKIIKEGRMLYISGLSAMFDRRRVKKPKAFIGDRSRDTYLIYGHRFHYCIGAHLSDKMMLAMFKALFSRHAAYQAGEKVRFRGAIPWHILVDYDDVAPKEEA